MANFPDRRVEVTVIFGEKKKGYSLNAYDQQGEKSDIALTQEALILAMEEFGRDFEKIEHTSQVLFCVGRIKKINVTVTRVD